MAVDRWAAQTWGPFGKSDPYYGVCSDEIYRSHRMDEKTRAHFFATGQEHVDHVLDTIRRTIDAGFQPRRVLDFGSGVGRLLIPLARTAERAVGVDISPEMIAEAKRNCVSAGLTNVDFVLSDDRLSAVKEQFDLVHSFIVIQHIPPARGERIFGELIGRVAPGGVAALQVTYGRAVPAWRKLVHRLRGIVPLVNAATNLVQRRPASEPLIPMYEYRLERLFQILRMRGCHQVHATLTDHGGHHGVMLVFRVPGPDDSGAG